MQNLTENTSKKGNNTVFLRLGHHRSIELTLFELMHEEISINVLPNQNRLAGHLTDCKRVSNGQMSGHGGQASCVLYLPKYFHWFLKDTLNIKMRLDFEIYLQYCVVETELQTSLCDSFCITFSWLFMEIHAMGSWVQWQWLYNV